MGTSLHTYVEADTIATVSVLVGIIVDVPCAQQPVGGDKLKGIMYVSGRNSLMVFLDLLIRQGTMALPSSNIVAN